jgi:Cell division protein CrgA
VPPPKRKTTGGRVTAKGTRPGQASVVRESHAAGAVSSSSRYTPPNPRDMSESPRWVPVLMMALIAIAVASILLRYLVWTDSNLPVVVGLAFLLAGLFVATKWR